MKQKVCPRNVLGHFKTKIRPKCFDETGPWLPFYSCLRDCCILVNNTLVFSKEALDVDYS